MTKELTEYLLESHEKGNTVRVQYFSHTVPILGGFY